MFTLKNTRDWTQAFVLCTLLGFANVALAAGGLSSIEGGIKAFFTSFYGIVAILAGFALLCVGLWGMIGQKHWGEVVQVAGWILLCAAGPVLVKALWDWGKSISL